MFARHARVLSSVAAGLGAVTVGAATQSQTADCAAQQNSGEMLASIISKVRGIEAHLASQAAARGAWVAPSGGDIARGSIKDVLAEAQDRLAAIAPMVKDQLAHDAAATLAADESDRLEKANAPDGPGRVGNRVLGDAGSGAGERPHRVILAGWPITKGAAASDPRVSTLDGLFKYVKESGYDGVEMTVGQFCDMYGDSPPKSVEEVVAKVQEAAATHGVAVSGGLWQTKGTSPSPVLPPVPRPILPHSIPLSSCTFARPLLSPSLLWKK